MLRQLARDLLRHYPQIYLACHQEHTRARTNRHGLADRDIVQLGHLDERQPLSAGPLARHLGVRPSTLSARLDRLEKLGHLARTSEIVVMIMSQGARMVAIGLALGLGCAWFVAAMARERSSSKL